MSVTLTRVDEFAVVTLDRPDALNALSFAILTELGAAFDQVAAGDARGLIVTGAGAKAFSAGADIKELTGRTLMQNRAGTERGQRIFAKLDTLPMPSIAVVNGFAFGGGLELALACTFRLALPGAKLGLPEIKLGLIPGYGGTQRLPRLIGEGRALELIMTGRTVEADEAVRIGLVNRLVPESEGGDAVAAGVAFGREFSRFGLPALRFARDAVKRALDLPLAEGLKIEADLSTLAYATEDAKEGMEAFMAKRKPTFKDG
jgi:enoyl-CoA hydratase